MTLEQLQAQLVAEGVEPSVVVLPSQADKDQPSLLGVRAGHSNRRNPKFGDGAKLKAGRI